MDFLQLAGKTVLVIGVANRKSVAFHIGRLLCEVGATVVYVVRNAARQASVSKIVDGADVLVCDVEDEAQIAQLRVQVGERHPVLHGLVHSIAFADYADGMQPFHKTSKRAFLRSVDVSCF